jgi:2-aminoadipate transaminase
MAHVAPEAGGEVSLAGWTKTLKPSALQDMLRASTRPGILSLALGLPAAELFPAADYAQSVARVLANDPRALQYGPPFQPLKRQVVELMEARGVVCGESQIFLTAGAQQGVHMLARLLLEPGATVVTEELTYTGFQQVLQPYQPRILTVPTDPATGMDVDALEQLFDSGERPSLVYSVTDGHNPVSVSMSREKRVRLAALARQYRVPVIEDDPYGFLFYEEAAPLAPLRAFEDRWVFYAGTFSKILAPGLRTGWLVVPEELIAPLSIVKESIDIDMAPLNQRAISDYIAAGLLEGHLDKLRREYRLRRDTMLRALGEHFPASARWNRPASGLFVWVELPEDADTGALLETAIESEQVAFLPGFAFNVGARPCRRNTMRLNFSNAAPQLIEEGIARLGRLLGRASS